jgi:hypothetical protein
MGGYDLLIGLALGAGTAQGYRLTVASHATTRAARR